MKLQNLVVENTINEILNELMFDYLSLINPSLMESVTSDCKYKKEMEHIVIDKVTKKKVKKIVKLAGLPGITDFRIEKLNKKELDDLLKQIERHNSILLTPSECSKAVKNKFNELNKKNEEPTLSSSFNKLLDELKNTVKEYITIVSKRPHNLKVYVPTKHKKALGIVENMNIDQIILKLSVFNSIDKSEFNDINLVEELTTYTEALIISMDNIVESQKYDTVTFSEYIGILKWIRKQIADSLIEQGLLDTIAKYKAHYDRFVELNK